MFSDKKYIFHNKKLLCSVLNIIFAYRIISVLCRCRNLRLIALRSFPNRYLFSLHNKVTSLFSIRYIFEFILQCNENATTALWLRGGRVRPAQFPESHGGCGRHIERVHLVGHGDAHHIVGGRNGVVGQPVALGAHHNGQPRLGLEAGVVERDGVGREGHGHRLEAQPAEATHRPVQPGPGQEEHRPHRHPDGAPVEGVAGVAREQHAVNAQRGRRAEDGPDVGGIDHTVDHHHALPAPAHLGRLALLRPPHGTEHTAREGAARIDRQAGAAGQQVGCVARNVAFLAEQGHGLVPGVEGHTNHLGALHDDETPVGLQPVAQLMVGEFAERLHAGMV